MMKYETNFLKNVILRLDFNSIANFNKDLLSEFHGKIKDKFSKPDLKQLNQFTYKIKGDVIEDNLKKEALGILDGINCTAQISFAPNFILITMKTYTTFESYTSFVNEILTAFNQVTNIEFLNRIGLRYVNQINIPKKNPLNWNSYISNSLFAQLKFFEDTHSIIRSVGQTVFNYDNYLMNFTYGILNPDYPGKIVQNEFILDYDCYAINIANEDLFENYINKFHNSIGDLFEKSINTKLREKMGVKNEL